MFQYFLYFSGNSDYQALLKCLAQLEAQRIQAIKDLDILYEKQKDALKDPIKFVDKLQKQEDLGLPKPQTVAQIPSLNWDNYTSNVDFTSLGIPKHGTRLKRQLIDGPGKFLVTVYFAIQVLYA